MNLFKFLKRIFTPPVFPTPPKFPTHKDIFEDLDKNRKEMGHYTCINGHKWLSKESPTGSFCASMYGMQETKCSTCQTTVCRVDFMLDGKIIWGAMHEGFLEPKQKVKKCVV